MVGRDQDRDRPNLGRALIINDQTFDFEPFGVITTTIP
jgi:hypothetical protein